MTDLASFEDRYTMRHVREYPHPIESVFEAITNTDEINQWLLPIAVVEPRVGGRCAFTWGGPRGAAMEGTVTEFDPPTLVHYDLLGSFLRFELEALDATRTRLVFRHRIDRAGVDTLVLWPPDVVSGFDEMVDAIGEVLAGTRNQQEVAEVIAQCEAGTINEWMANRPSEWHAERSRVQSIYREHILAACPPEDPSIAGQPTAFEAAIRGKSDAEITAWADSAGGLEAVCDLVLAEMRNRLRPDRELTIAYDLGFEQLWQFTTENSTATLKRGNVAPSTTLVMMTPHDFLRVVANDISGDEAINDGRIKVDGDAAELRRFFAMTPRGRGES